MSDGIFITRLEIKKVRHLEDLTITLSETERRHLILTGTNGSGKTSFLEGLDFQLRDDVSAELKSRNDENPPIVEVSISDKNIDLTSSKPECGLSGHKGFLYFYFRESRECNFQHVCSPTKLTFSDGQSDRSAHFLQFLVNLKFKRSLARDDNDERAVHEIDKWLEWYTHLLRELHSDSELEIEFDRDEFNFLIHTANREPFYITQLSRGYSAVMSIISEIVLRMAKPGRPVFEAQGIVLIDEIETHLHIELQKRILPFLSGLFPRIQFIVSTHSEFIKNSMDDAVVFDLSSTQSR